jgi:hypothetical protein
MACSIADSAVPASRASSTAISRVVTSPFSSTRLVGDVLDAGEFFRRGRFRMREVEA